MTFGRRRKKEPGHAQTISVDAITLHLSPKWKNAYYIFSRTGDCMRTPGPIEVKGKFLLDEKHG
jgi:hypothetical protein